jgi:hypothetical protein
MEHGYVAHPAIGVRGFTLLLLSPALANANSLPPGTNPVLKVLDHMFEHGDIDELHRLIQRQGRQINRIQGLRPRARQQ